MHWLRTVTADVLFRPGRRASCASIGTVPGSTGSSDEVSRGLSKPSSAQIVPSHHCLSCSQRRLHTVHPAGNAEDDVELSRQRAGSPPHPPTRGARGRLGRRGGAQTSPGHHVGVLFTRRAPDAGVLLERCRRRSAWRSCVGARCRCRGHILDGPEPGSQACLRSYATGRRGSPSPVTPVPFLASPCPTQFYGELSVEFRGSECIP